MEDGPQENTLVIGTNKESERKEKDSGSCSLCPTSVDQHHRNHQQAENEERTGPERRCNVM